MTIASVILFSVGVFITLTNFYLSFLRYPIHLALGGSRETFRWISGFPIVGSLMLWLSIPLSSSVELRWLAAIASLFDTGGIHWFFGVMWWTGEIRGFLHGRWK